MVLQLHFEHCVICMFVNSRMRIHKIPCPLQKSCRRHNGRSRDECRPRIVNVHPVAKWGLHSVRRVVRTKTAIHAASLEN